MKPIRCGVILLECLFAMSLLAIGMVITAQVLAVYARTRGIGDRLLAAQWEAANVQERIATLSYEQATLEAFEQIQLSPETKSALPGAKLNISIVESADSTSQPIADAPPVAENRKFQSKCIRVEIAWPNAEGGFQNVALNAWKFLPTKEASP